MGALNCNCQCHYYLKSEYSFFENLPKEENKKDNEIIKLNQNIPKETVDSKYFFEIPKFSNLISEKILSYIKNNKLSYKSYIFSLSKLSKSDPIELPDGNIFFGNLNIDNEIDGYGIYILKSKSIITEGIWKKGNIIFGRIFFPNDDIYEGEIENSQPHGTGIFYKANNEIYKGTFVEGEIDGKGTYIYSDKSFYCGEIKKGIFNGEGSMKWNDGTEYHGNFKNSYLNGKGKMFNNILKEKYVGNFDKNEFNGNGVYTYKNGDIYEGNFEYGMRKGKGVYTRNDNVIFDIIWNDDLPNGNGIVKYNGNQLKGSWRNGNFLGKKQIIKGNINNFNKIDLNFKQNKRLLQPNQLPHLAINDEKDSGQYIIGSQWSEI
jgi:hypothetical protein